MKIVGKVVFITGGAQGIGRGVAEAVLEKGGKVFLADVNAVAGKDAVDVLAVKHGRGRVEFGKCDVTSREQFTDVFKRAVTLFGNIDIMVNNAGIMNEKMFEQEIAINFNGVVTGTHLALAHMRKDKGGKGGAILNTSSVAGVIPWQWFPVYGATKAAVLWLTKSYAESLHNEEMAVRFACLCPDATDTNLLNVLAEKTTDFDSLQRFMKFITPLPVSEVADACVQLMEDDDCNGKNVAVQSGRTFYFEQKTEPAMVGVEEMKQLLQSIK